MANHDLILGQSHNLRLSQNQQLILGHDHNLGVSQNHDLELGQAHEHHLGMGHDHELDLGHHNDHELGLEQSQDDEGEVGHGYGHENSLGMDRKPEQGGHELVLTSQNHELDLSENNELVVSENHELDDNLELTVVQEQEMGLESVQDLTIEQSQLMVYSPVIQARSLSIAPNFELAVGQEFPDVFSCRRALRDTAIALHFEMQTIKSDKTRFTAKCASEGCPWRIHAAKLPGVPTFTIRTIHESHICGGISHLGHQQASVQWVANSVEQRLKENPNYRPKEILEEIHRVHGITLSYKQAWRGKERIMAAMRGSFEEGYRLLPQYCDQVKRTNPGSIASVYGNLADNCFQRLFISFQASIYGFLNACRPLLGLDRTFLKSKVPWYFISCHWL
ncbi:POLYPROTEIN putative-RELATED [Salix koriyanagi]|uniref:POLYPROTEIN putative-RELATED n=1 Tax=Salix koriyanagi TaxID=2511006 RepID=A0A9Q1A3W4_9ROSI|nr:POLYPROTEIN putative-RELATED [Salix koriyanagi]